MKQQKTAIKKSQQYKKKKKKKKNLWKNEIRIEKSWKRFNVIKVDSHFLLLLLLSSIDLVGRVDGDLWLVERETVAMQSTVVKTDVGRFGLKFYDGWLPFFAPIILTQPTPQRAIIVARNGAVGNFSPDVSIVSPLLRPFPIFNRPFSFSSSKSSFSRRYYWHLNTNKNGLDITGLLFLLLRLWSNDFCFFLFNACIIFHVGCGFPIDAHWLTCHSFHDIHNKRNPSIGLSKLVIKIHHLLLFNIRIRHHVELIHHDLFVFVGFGCFYCHFDTSKSHVNWNEVSCGFALILDGWRCCPIHQLFPLDL